MDNFTKLGAEIDLLDIKVNEVLVLIQEYKEANLDIYRKKDPDPSGRIIRLYVIGKVDRIIKKVEEGYEIMQRMHESLLLIAKQNFSGEDFLWREKSIEENYGYMGKYFKPHLAWLAYLKEEQEAEIKNSHLKSKVETVGWDRFWWVATDSLSRALGFLEYKKDIDKEYTAKTGELRRKLASIVSKCNKLIPGTL